jgi:hypothetical protein
MGKYKNDSKLLIDEEPLQVLPSLATEIGLNQAVFLQQIHYWLKFNAKAKRNFKDGRHWTYNSYKDWQEQFPFFSTMTLRRIVADLKKRNLLITGHFNKKGYDRTTWYSINYEALAAIEEVINSKCSNRTNASVQSEQMEVFNLNKPIPEIYPENISEILDLPSQEQTKRYFEIVKKAFKENKK